jgi:hypothetical protein
MSAISLADMVQRPANSAVSVARRDSIAALLQFCFDAEAQRQVKPAPKDEEEDNGRKATQRTQSRRDEQKATGGLRLGLQL